MTLLALYLISNYREFENELVCFPTERIKIKSRWKKWIRGKMGWIDANKVGRKIFARSFRFPIPKLIQFISIGLQWHEWKHFMQTISMNFALMGSTALGCYQPIQLHAYIRMPKYDFCICLALFLPFNLFLRPAFCVCQIRNKQRKYANLIFAYWCNSTTGICEICVLAKNTI